MFKIVESSHTTTRAEITVEGDSIEELMRAEATNIALAKAAEFGLHRPGVSNSTGVYPVDSNGNSGDDVMSGQTKVAAYRRDYVLLGSI